VKPRGRLRRSNPDVGALALEFAAVRGLRWTGATWAAGPGAGRTPSPRSAAESDERAAAAPVEAAASVGAAAPVGAVVPVGAAAPVGSVAAAGDARAEEAARVARARGGDEAAFRALVEAHADRVYAVALRVLRSPADAEEAAQDAFVRAWRALPAFRGDAAFGTWLHRIAVRVALDRAAVLRTRRGREIADALAGSESAGERRDDAADDRARRLEALLARLPEIQRVALSLYYWQDRSVLDVAAALGLPANTVKTHLARGRAALRAAWLATEER
jgi:RNA polymerase sigma-70 factor (ECF subfamily)